MCTHKIFRTEKSAGKFVGAASECGLKQSLMPRPSIFSPSEAEHRERTGRRGETWAFRGDVKYHDETEPTMRRNVTMRQDLTIMKDVTMRRGLAEET